MKRFNIIQKSTGNILDFGNFETEEQGHEWFAPFIQAGRYGKSEETIQVVVSDYVPATYDEEDVELTPAIEAVYEDVVIPAEYEVVITDVTAITEAINQIAEAKAYLTSTDYMAIREFEGGEPMPLAVKTERAAKRLLINSLEPSLN